MFLFWVQRSKWPNVVFGVSGATGCLWSTIIFVSLEVRVLGRRFFIIYVFPEATRRVGVEARCAPQELAGARDPETSLEFCTGVSVPSRDTRTGNPKFYGLSYDLLILILSGCRHVHVNSK